MSNQHSVIALDWLNPVLQRVFGELAQMLASREPSIDVELASDRIHEVTGALRLINQLELAKLSETLEQVVTAIHQGELNDSYFANVNQSISLLQYELKQLQQTQRLHSDWIADRVNYFQALLGENVAHTTTFLDQMAEVSEPAILPDHLDTLKTVPEATDPAALLKVWRYHTLQLLNNNVNEASELQALASVASYLAKHSDGSDYRKLWQITHQWLSSLLQNERPTPHQYAYILNELDSTIQDTSLSSIDLSTLAVDVLLQSVMLQNKSEQLQHLLTPLKLIASDDNATLFKQVLTKLEQSIFQMATPAAVLPQLQDIKTMLSNRGWQFYESHLDQIISDIQMMIDDPSSADMISWQVERQMQDLYSQLMQTTDTLENQVGIADFSYARNPQQEAVRQTRIHLENIKLAFNDYIQSRNIANLLVNDDLMAMSQVFDSLGLERPKVLAEQLRVLFGQLESHQINMISWETSDTLAEMIAQFELFLDYLSHQNVNDALLEQTQQLLQRGNTLVASEIQQPLQPNQLHSRDKKYSSPTAVYDDEGETIVESNLEGSNDDAAAALPDDTASLIDNDNHYHDGQDSTTTPAIDTLVSTTQPSIDSGESEALQHARSLLKPDDDSTDEDIREIFIEEADEVLSEMGTNLATWQADSNDLATLKDIRRGFHTLKGSGRMVGAFQVGETAWAVENMLNRVLDNTLLVSDDMVTFIKETHAQLPTLIADYEAGRQPSIDPAIIILKATNLTQQRPLLQGLSVEDGSLSDTESTSLAITDTAISPQAEVATDSANVTNATSVVIPAVLQQEIDSLVWKDDDIMDEDIQEIYVEEAGEVLEEITPLYQVWQENTDDTAILKEIRRGFHTLKGSGRMVGAKQLGELGWSIENMLNRVLEGTIEADTGVVALLGDVIAAFPSLVTIFAQSRDDYPSSIRLWAAVANLYSKKQGDSFDYRQIAQQATAQPVATVPSIPVITDEMGYEASDTVVVDAQSEADMDANDLAFDNSATPVVENDTLVSMPTDSELTVPQSEENVIGQVFFEESQELFKNIDKFIDDHQNETEIAVPDELVRVFHTLRGGAALSELPRVHALSAALENGLDNLIRSEKTLTADKLDILSQARHLLASYMEDYQQQQPVTTQAEDDQVNQQLLQALFAENEHEETLTQHAMSVTQLLELDIDDLLEADIYYTKNTSQEDAEQIHDYIATLFAQATRFDAAVSDSKFAPLAQSLKATYRSLHQYPALLADEEIANLLLQTHAQLTNVFDEIAAGMNIHWDESITSRLMAVVAEKVYQQQLAQIEYEEVFSDNDLVEIFLDEVATLDERFKASFNQWQNNLSNMQAVTQLQQYTNAIVGGARLVGIQSIYPLANAAKNIFTAVLNGTLASSTDLVDMMQLVYDTLVTQIQYIQQRSVSFYATQLQQQLEDILKSGELSNDELWAVPVLVTDAHARDSVEAIEVATEVMELPQTTTEYSQDIINNFEQRRIETWGGQEPDEDILQIFLEEAKELVDSSSQNLQEFRSNTNNLSALQALQRELHTIKGGARMVGAEGLATLAHEMETVYEELGSRRKPATRMIGNLLAACHDWLASALYVLENKYNPELPNALVDALLQFSKNPDSLKAVPQASLANQIEQIKIYQSSLVAKQEGEKRDISVMPLQAGNFAEVQEQTNTLTEMIRVPASLMERMINLSGESAINRARIDMGVSSLTNTIEEMGVTVKRLADQLRRMETELEVQILSQIDDELLQNVEFDPLEMDQYSSLNQLSKSLSESASDLLDIKTTMLDKTQDTENLLLQLSRTQLELQEGLMSSRTVPFSRITPRLQRIVRQTANELNKSVELRILNDEGEIDRNILERITSPLEHMLRNAVDHGIERTQERIESGKPRTGLITLEIEREGDEIVIYLTDDGKGINVEAVRKKAIEQGLISADDTSLKSVDIMQYIFNAGLSTSTSITQISGRGVGMDVVQSEIKQMGGVVSADSEAGKGSRFIMRLPLTVAVSDALVVKAGDKNFAVPLVQIERVVRINAESVYEFYDSEATTIDIDGEEYRLRYLNQILYNTDPRESVRHQTASVPVIIIRNEAGQKLALQVDALAGSRVEVVVKPLGRQLSHISGISAATIMGDGSVMLILDLNALMRNAIYTTTTTTKKASVPAQTSKPVVLIIDDSVTVRKVTSRLLERQGYETQVAKDGIDALEKLQDLTPDIMLLDIEMPRMDGFEVATQVRHNSRLKQVPIIMITSRTGEKHRERAISIGVNEYMGKPFQEQQLIDNISKLLSSRSLTQ